MLDNFNKFNELRAKYKTFTYEDFKVINNPQEIILEYYFKIDNLAEFHPKITIPKKEYIINEKIQFSDSFAFHIGMIELISYWKCACPQNVVIKCGKLDEQQKAWFKKLYFYGLGAVGSGAGLRQIEAKTVDFGASDAPLK